MKSNIQASQNFHSATIQNKKRPVLGWALSSLSVWDKNSFSMDYGRGSNRSRPLAYDWKTRNAAWLLPICRNVRYLWSTACWRITSNWRNPARWFRLFPAEEASIMHNPPQCERVYILISHRSAESGRSSYGILMPCSMQMHRDLWRVVLSGNLSSGNAVGYRRRVMTV